MKILLLTSIYPEPKEYCVPEDSKAIHYFAREFIKQGHEVVVCHLYSNPISRIGKMGHVIGENRIRINSRDGVKVVFSSIQIFIPHKYCGFKCFQIQNAKIVKKYLLEEIHYIPDVVFVHYPTTFLYFCEELIGNWKASCVLHNTDLVELESRNARDNNSYRDKIKKIFHVIGFRSKKLLERGIKIGLADEKSPIILSGITKNLIFSADQITKKISSTTPIKSLLFVGRLNEQKRVNVILKAISLCKTQCVLRIIGDGPQKDEFIKLAKDLGVSERVSFLGTMRRESVSKAMYDSDVFVMVSKGETLGLVYLEAMAAGCLTIGSRGEGIDGIIRNAENGFLVTPDDVNELAMCIDYVLNAPREKVGQISLNGYNTAIKMTDDLLATSYVNSLCYISNP